MRTTGQWVSAMADAASPGAMSATPSQDRFSLSRFDGKADRVFPLGCTASQVGGGVFQLSRADENLIRLDGFGLRHAVYEGKKAPKTRSAHPYSEERFASLRRGVVCGSSARICGGDGS